MANVCPSSDIHAIPEPSPHYSPHEMLCPLPHSQLTIIFLAVLFQTTRFSSAFKIQQQTLAYKPRISLFSTAIETQTNEAEQPLDSPKPCFYKRVDGNWRARKQLNQLFIGQRLMATRLSECDLINGVTGPKAFLECGVGRVTDTKGEWKIVNGMLRLGKRTGKKNRMKESVVRKKLAKLPDDSLFAVYVSKINLVHASFEGKLQLY